MGSFVLLCCLRPAGPPSSIDEGLFSKVFEPYGRLKSLHVFSRRHRIKAFAEFFDEASLAAALQHLHEAVLPIGKLKLYRSAKPAVLLQPPARSGPTSVESFGIPKSLTSQVNLTKFDNEGNGSGLFELPCESNSSHYHHYPQSQSQSQSGSFNHYPQFQSQRQIEYRGHGSWKEAVAGGCPFSLKVGQVPLSSDARTSCGRGENESLGSQLAADKVNSARQIAHLAEIASKKRASGPGFSNVLAIGRLNCALVRPAMLRNLVGCYGNVFRVVLDSRRCAALVQMESAEQAREAQQHLNGLQFFGEPLELSVLPSPHLDLATLEAASAQEVSLLEGHAKYFRYKQGLSIRVNPLARVLHLTSMAESVTPLVLLQLLQQIHEPTRIVQLARRGLNSRMFLVEFESVVQSAEVLAVLHNKLIDQKMVKVSFSQTKID